MDCINPQNIGEYNPQMIFNQEGYRSHCSSDPQHLSERRRDCFTKVFHPTKTLELREDYFPLVVSVAPTGFPCLEGIWIAKTP
jgi:hypothetical protein